jgi:serine/threonine protein kinase
VLLCTFSRILFILFQLEDLLDGLEYLHHRGLYHGDLHMASSNIPEPSIFLTKLKDNLLVTRRSEDGLSNTPLLWIADFGLSGVLEGEPATQASNLTERSLFQAPEIAQYLNDRTKKQKLQHTTSFLQRADIFSLGVVLFFVSIFFCAFHSLLRRVGADWRLSFQSWSSYPSTRSSTVGPSREQ